MALARRILLSGLGVLWLVASHGALVSAGEHFRVAERQGAWWFIDPAGQPFWSQGVAQIVTGPKDSDASRQYAAHRYYKSDEAWADDVIERLDRWEFNTLGGWHDKLLRPGLPAYAEVLHLGIMEGAPWNDLFADSFADSMNVHAAKGVAAHRDDPRVLGWFSDNELAWYPDLLFDFHLKQPATSATRQRLIRILDKHYGGDFVRLQADFEPSTGVDDFAELGAGGLLRRRAGGKGQQVIDKFAEAAADRYYSVVCSAIRKHDPNHLVLGDRYHGFCPDPIVLAAGRHVDVVSTNYDWPRGVDGYLPRAYLRRLHELSGKPVLVTEYYAAATDNRSGNPNSGGLFVVVPSQPDRAAVARERLRLFAEEPYIVGAHWFAFADEPPAGRASDGEDYNFGLVDIDNRPYEEVTNAIAEGHSRAAKRHALRREDFGGAGHQPLNIPQLPPVASISEVDESLARQLLIPAHPTGGIADLLAATSGDALYLSLVGNHYIDDRLYVERPVPLSEGLTWRVEVAVGDSRATIEVRMLGDRHEAVEGDLQFVHWHRGVRYGATVAVTARDLGLEHWQAGAPLRLESQLIDQQTEATTTWKSALQPVETHDYSDAASMDPAAMRVESAQPEVSIPN